MLRNLLRLSASGKPIYGTPDIGLLASQIISETATGDQGPGLLYDEALAQTGRQLRVKITSYSGTSGKLFVFENGSILIDGEADGAYTIGYDWEAWASDGSVNTGSDTASVSIGQVNATAPAANVTGTGTISAADATGEASATAPAANVTGTGSISAGQPSSEQNATAPDANVTGTSSISAPDATGGGSGDATAPAANVTGSSSIDAGQAVGEQNAMAPAANVTGAGLISAGDATGGGSFSGSLSDEDIARIVVAVMAAMNATTIPVNVKAMNSATVIGDGSEIDPWRGQGVQP